ncbi:MAG TPA: sigma-70 family RNA polymerase sigma factor [Gemmataceae bacterium]|jgi:RNA polymerase sigma factor (sigma-70 family)
MRSNAPGLDAEQTWMCGPASDGGNDPSDDDRAAYLREVIQREHPTLLRRIGALVYKLCGPLRREEVADRIAEILSEVAIRALQAADRFERGRSAIAWLMGIALHVLQERRRDQRRSPVVQSDLGEEKWRHVVDELCAVDSDTATIRLDIRQALARLKESQRHILELRYVEGLDGEEFAQAACAPSVGAARLRLARALQALRRQFGLAGGEVTS